MLSLDPKELTIPVLQKYLQNAVAPRPICFASTIKDNYLHFLQNNYSQEEYNILLEYVNNNIINGTQD